MQPDRGRAGAAIESKSQRPGRWIANVFCDIRHKKHLRLWFSLGRINRFLALLRLSSRGLWLRIFALFFLRSVLLGHGVSEQQITGDCFVSQSFPVRKRQAVLGHNRWRRLKLRWLFLFGRWVWFRRFCRRRLRALSQEHRAAHQQNQETRGLTQRNLEHSCAFAIYPKLPD